MIHSGIEQWMSMAVGGQGSQSPVLAPGAIWQHHGVKVTALAEHFQVGRQPNDEVDQEALSEFIGSHFGPYVQKKVDQRLKKVKKLKVRSIASVVSHVRKEETALRKWNRNLVFSDVDEELISKVFNQIQKHQNTAKMDVQWSALPPHEREHLIEAVKVRLLEHDDKIEPSDLIGCLIEMISRHQTLFSVTAPRVYDLLIQSGFPAPVKPGDLRHLGEQKYFSTRPPGEELTREEMGLLRNVDTLINRSASILNTPPLDNLHAQPLWKQKNEARAHAFNVMKGFLAVQKHGQGLSPGLQQAMIDDLREQFDAVCEHYQQLNALIENNPLNNDSWQAFKRNELEAAQDVLSQEMESMASKPGAFQQWQLPHIQKTLTEYKELVRDVEARKDERRLPGGGGAKTGIIGKLGERPVKDAQLYSDLITRRLEGLGIKKVADKMREARARRMSSQVWSTVHTTLQPRINGVTLNLSSRITPAAEFKIHKDGEEGVYDVFPRHLQGVGISSIQTEEAEHAVNLGESELMVEDSGQIKPLFRGLRSATVSAYGIKNKSLRQVASESRCKDILVSGLKQLWETSPELFEWQPVPLKLSTLSLLTPDRLRHISGLHDDELSMLNGQLEAFTSLQKKLRQGEALEFSDSSGQRHSVNVDLDFVALNFGVDDLALKGTRQLFSGAWGASKSLNKRGLSQLMGSLKPGEAVGGWVREYLDSADQKDRDIVLQLVGQIRDLYDTGDYKSEEDDAYKMAIRVLLLSYRIGLVTHYSCKTGSDRTGEADAGVKRLAAEIEALGYVPDPRQIMNHEERALSQMMALESGNIRWQQMNSNRPGYDTTTGKNRVGPSFYQEVHTR